MKYGNLDDDTTHAVATQPGCVSDPDHSFTIAKNVHGAFTKQSLSSVGMIFIHFKPAC